VRASLGCALALAGCVTHRGPWHDGPAPPAEPEAVTIVALGGAGRGGAAAEHSAEALDRVLADSRARGRPATVLWLGDAVASNPLGVPRCPDAGEAWTRDGIRDLARVVREHVAAGGASLGVPGAAEWRCGAATAGAPLTWTAPALVRIDDRGRATVASGCDAKGCSIAKTQTPARLELVLLDLWPWMRPNDVVDAPGRVARTEALLAALPHGESMPPRVLVLVLPIEGALARGQGGRGRPLATFHNLPPVVQDAILGGEFIGVIAGGEHAQYTARDVGWPIRRTEKVWLRQPVWQVVSGAVADANARPGAAYRRSAVAHGIGWEPAVRTDHPGFTVVSVADDGAQAVLSARVRRRWQHARVALPLSVAPHPRQGAAPVMAPCLRCTSVPANERP